MWKCLPVFLLLSLAAAQAQKPKDEGWSDLLPPGDSRDLVLNSCIGCHNLKVVVQARKTPAEWSKCLNDMIQRGAQLFPEEIEPIRSYFVKSFGKDVPKLVNVNTAGREDLEKSANLPPETAARIVEARGKNGPFRNSEELRRALGMEKEEFEKIHYRLAYSN
jgi:competence ComEA-like helix-hairpin-helix protein